MIILTRQSRQKGQERPRRIEQAGKAPTGQKRQDRIDRKALTGQHDRQVRTTRARKTGSGKLNHTIGTFLCRQQRISPCKIQILYSIDRIDRTALTGQHRKERIDR